MITLTDTAAVKVKELLQAEGADDMALRVAVRPGGCSGFSYEMFFDSDIAADDEQANYGEDVRVVVDLVQGVEHRFKTLNAFLLFKGTTRSEFEDCRR